MMNDRAISTEDQTSLGPGEIKFYDNFLPKLPSGDYELQVTQEIEGDGLGQKSFEQTQSFTVRGPRFRLPPGEIHSVYPPPKIAANYDGVLAQMTFRKRNLPWERTVYTGKEKQQFASPWIALMVFEEGELITEKTDDPTQVTNTKAVVRSTSEVIDPGDEFLKPNLKALDTDEKDCFTIEMSKADFLTLAPKEEELAYLAHVREVNTDHKPFLGMHADGWFSVLLANRLPKTPKTLPVGDGAGTAIQENYVRNIVHLVSLEGFTEFLVAQPESAYQTQLDDAKLTKVRLASLASWEFQCKPPKVSFEELMKDLKADTLKTEKLDEVQNLNLKKALEGGYAPLQYHSRMGQKTMAWYRGPLLPVITSTSDSDDETFFSAESSFIFDKDNGMFDLSYAVAWQIGRLLALSDSHFSNTLLDWKKMAAAQIEAYLRRSSLQSTDTASNNSSSPSLSEIQQLMSPEFKTNALYDNFLVHLDAAKSYFKHLSDQTEDQLDLELKGYPGILSEEAYQEAHKAGTDLQEAILNILKKA